MISDNCLLTEQVKILSALPPSTPGAGTRPYVSMKDYSRLAIMLRVLNAGTGVTGAPVTLKQAKDVAGTGVKALPMASVAVNLDAAANDTLTQTTVTNNTFTTDATVSKDITYVIEVKDTDLDIANNFDCVALAFGAGGAAAVISATYLLWGARYGRTTPPSAVVD